MTEEIMTDDLFEALVEKAAQAGRKVVCLIEDEDGNWRGAYAKNGKNSLDGGKDGAQPTVFARQVGPETVLQMLLTHE